MTMTAKRTFSGRVLWRQQLFHEPSSSLAGRPDDERLTIVSVVVDLVKGIVRSCNNK